jgi:hypothetical protein
LGITSPSIKKKGPYKDLQPKKKNMFMHMFIIVFVFLAEAQSFTQRC